MIKPKQELPAQAKTKLSRSSDLSATFSSLRHYFLTALAFSLAINLLYLAAPLYMMQVYDRVLSSNSEATLAMLTLLVLLAFSTLALLDCLRARILARSATRFDRLLAGRLFRSVMVPILCNPAPGNQPLRDLETTRNFIAGNGMHAIFDFPWTPIYVFIIYRLHPSLGSFALVCAVALIVMALINEVWVRGMSSRANALGVRAHALSEQSQRNSDVVHAMGMLADVTEKWTTERQAVLSAQQAAGERAAIVSSLIRFLRLAMQSLILGLGAWLVVERATSAGTIFAASILLGRALQPVEQAAASWKAMVGAREALGRLGRLAATLPIVDKTRPIARPEGQVVVDKMSFSAPRSETPILRDISFTIEPGEIVGIIGASGAGKSTLARLLVGIAEPSNGSVRLAGVDMHTPLTESLRRHVGYLPQDIELFSDTVAANIARFSDQSPAKITDAAKLAGVHEMILCLPQGYQTTMGSAGTMLSGGWQQRVALARAAYGHPSMVVLDEPNSNLDTQGEESLAACIKRLSERSTTVVVISHRPAMLRIVDKIIILTSGRVEWFGARDDMLKRFANNVKSHTTLEKGVSNARS